MKKVFQISGILLANVLLVLLAYIIYYGFTESIIRVTRNPYHIEMTLLFVIGFIGGVTYFIVSNKYFKRFGIGIIAILISTIIFSVFYFNRSFAFEGEYKSFALRSAISTDEHHYLNIAFNMWYNRTEVSQEVCLDVDSVEVRIDKGLFGMKTMSNSVKIVESNNCEHIDVDSSNLSRSYLKIGHELAQKRCFSGAIEHYSNSIELDSIHPDAYYHRGLMLMTVGKYDKAIIDFVAGAIIMNNGIEDELTKLINPEDVEQLIEQVDNKEFDKLAEFVDYIKTKNDLNLYQQRIKFCMEKLIDK